MPHDFEHLGHLIAGAPGPVCRRGCDASIKGARLTREARNSELEGIIIRVAGGADAIL